MILDKLPGGVGSNCQEELEKYLGGLSLPDHLLLAPMPLNHYIDLVLCLNLNIFF